MGAVGGMLGTAGGAAGTGFTAPERFNAQTVTTPEQVQQGQAGVTNSLASQQALLAALQGQGAIGYQSQAGAQQKMLADQLNQTNAVGTQNAALNQQANFNQQLAGANGIGTQNAAVSGLQNVAAQQQGTAGLYQNIAEGRGPNPAQAMLNQQTGQNVANQAALMAGQRGAGANIGLLARQAAMQGANAQQQAVGQGAALQAQQQINALSGLTGAQQAQAQTQQAIGGLGTQQAGMQQAGIMNQAQQAQAQMAAQAAANQAVVNQTNLLAQQHIGAQQAAVQGNLANAGQLQGALGNMNSANVSSQGNVNTSNAALGSSQMQGQRDVVGGLMQAGGQGAKFLAAAQGGEVRKMADGGDLMSPVQAPVSSFSQYLQARNGGGAPTPPAVVAPPAEKGPDLNNKNDSDLKQGSKALGEGVLALAGVGAAEGGLAVGGGPVAAASPGQKAEKSGNSYDNDKIPAMLSEGEIVIPRSITMGEDPLNAATKFVADTLAKRKSPQKMKEGGEVTSEKEVDDKDKKELLEAAPPAVAEEASGLNAAPNPATPPQAPEQAPDAAALAPMPAEAPVAAPSRAPLPQAPAAAPAPQAPKTQTTKTLDDRNAEDIAWQQDLANRHIHPKTYSDMFAKNDDGSERGTLGKIGMLFGLLVSGAGAGLTHQPNALLEMMNKEIERDLEAQKQSKANANSFLQTQFAHDVQLGQAAEHFQNIQTKQAENAGLLQENLAKRQRNVKALGGSWDPALEQSNAQLAAPLQAKNKMLSVVGQHLTDVSANNPAGLAAVKNIVQPAINQQIQQNNAQIDAKVKTNTALQAAKKNAAGASQAKQGSGNDDVIDMKKYRQMANNGELNTKNNIALNFSTDIDPQDRPKIDQEINDLRTVSNNYKDTMDAFNEIARMPNAGQAPLANFAQSLKKFPWFGDALASAAMLGQGKLQRPRDQLIDALAQRLAKSTNSDEATEKLKNAITPSMFDSREGMKKGAELLYQHFAHSKEANAPISEKYGIKKDLKKIEFQAPKKEPGESEPGESIFSSKNKPWYQP